MASFRSTVLQASGVSSRCFIALATTLAVAAPAMGQQPVTEEGLRDELQTRDAVIIELQRRLEELEQKLSDEGVIEVEPVETVEPVAEPRPGDGLDVDELAAERALERTLVDEGALLLEAGQAEIQPTISFLHRDNRVPFIVGGQVVESRVKRDEFEFGLTLAAGLPFDSQLELRVPYNLAYQETSARGGGVPLDADDDWGSAVGDISIGLAKTVLRENGNWWPDIVVRGIWDTNTGERADNGVPLEGSFNELRGQIVALKRQDPLAFTAAFFYSYTFEDDDIQPGQQVGLNLGASLALSPETSLSVALSQSYADDLEVDGNTLNGSNQTSATFDFGGSTIIARRTLLRLTSSIGLTDDAPDYGLRAAVSYRFNTPFF